MWDQHSSSVRDRLAVAGWTRFTFDALHQFANERAGPGALSEDETTSITSEYARGAQVVKLSLNMSDFLCACRFDAKGHATALPVKVRVALVERPCGLLFKRTMTAAVAQSTRRIDENVYLCTHYSIHN